MKILRPYYLTVIICLLLDVTYADYLKVSRSSTIKAEPNREATVIKTVSRGTCLQLLDEGRQTNGYYKVSIADSESGWIYRTLVRRHPGDIPLPVETEPIVNPLSDPTYNLTQAKQQLAAKHLRIGKPQAVYERVYEGYVLAQSAMHKIPLWVQYELTPDDLRVSVERVDSFRADTSIPTGSRAELEDYYNSGFDRGHMAPAEDMSRSQEVMSESFFLSNMAPQVGIGFNRHIWANLEAAVRKWVKQRGTLTIITGPVFAVEANRVSYQVIGEDAVAVPSHFFKIVVDAQNPNDVKALAFLLPNTALSGHKIDEFLTSIDNIENLTGLDFLSALPTAVQADVESKTATAIW
jgi:endonuclease G